MDSILTPGEGLFCTGCGIFCEYRVVKSNEKGNKGRVMVSVSLASVLFLLYLTFPNQCNQVKDGVSCNFFRWKKGSTRSPTASPTLTTTSPNLPTPSPTLPTYGVYSVQKIIAAATATAIAFGKLKFTMIGCT